MPSAKTETSELSVAFGILGLDPTHVYPQSEIELLLGGFLSGEKYIAFRAEYNRDTDLYERLLRVGRIMSHRHLPFKQAGVVKWTGPLRQASTASVAKDLLVANTPVSVKTDSNVVANLSPPNMMANLPGGTAYSSREENWYLTLQTEEFQELYTFVRGMSPDLQYLPENIRSFEEEAHRDDRKRIQKILKESSARDKKAFTKRYRELCHRVAEKSADLFNQNLAASLSTGARKAVRENLIRWFFRLNAVQYVLCGIDRNEEFALVVPDLTSWLREWDLAQVVATPDITRGQSVVDFEVVCRRKKDRSEHRAPFHAEIRWSHGRFSGAVESKLYKEFAWSELPFLVGL
jgi:hypothetical protein